MDRGGMLANLRRTRFAPGDRRRAVRDARAIAADLEEEFGARVIGFGSAFAEDLTKFGDELHEATGGDYTYSLRAQGSILHHCYSADERVLIRIAEELDGGVPRGAGWRRQLLEDMELETPDLRPAVVSHGPGERLNEFLRVRHVFWNVYGFVRRAGRMATLEQELDAVLDPFVAWMPGR